MTSAGEENGRIRTAELRKDVEYMLASLGRLTVAVDDLRQEQRSGQERIKAHIDMQFSALKQQVADQAQKQAVFEARSTQWQRDHERRHEEHDEQHERDHAEQARKVWTVDAITALAAALAGVLIPGAKP